MIVLCALFPFPSTVFISIPKDIFKQMSFGIGVLHIMGEESNRKCFRLASHTALSEQHSSEMDLPLGGSTRELMLCLYLTTERGLHVFIVLCRSYPVTKGKNSSSMKQPTILYVIYITYLDWFSSTSVISVIP